MKCTPHGCFWCILRGLLTVLHGLFHPQLQSGRFVFVALLQVVIRRVVLGVPSFPCLNRIMRCQRRFVSWHMYIGVSLNVWVRCWVSCRLGWRSVLGQVEERPCAPARSPLWGCPAAASFDSGFTSAICVVEQVAAPLSYKHRSRWVRGIPLDLVRYHCSKLGSCSVSVDGCNSCLR